MTEDDVLQFDAAAYERARARMSGAPIDLTTDDFVQLALVSAQLERDGRAALRAAQLEIVRKNQAGAPLVTKSEPAPPPQTTQEFLERYGHKRVTYKALSGVTDVLMDCLKRAKVRADAQDAWILELEATVAARDVRVVEQR